MVFFLTANKWKQPQYPALRNRLLAGVHHWLESSEGLRSQVFRDYLMALENESDVILSKKQQAGASLVAQWLRIRLPMQGTRV